MDPVGLSDVSQHNFGLIARVFVTHPDPPGAWALSTRVLWIPDVGALLQYYRTHDRSTSAPGQLVHGVGDRTLVGRRGHRLGREPGFDARVVEWPLALSGLGREAVLSLARYADAATCLERGGTLHVTGLPVLLCVPQREQWS